MMRDLRLRCILTCMAVVSLLATTAFAQGTSPLKPKIDELKAKFVFVKRLDAKYPDSGFGKTWALLEGDASRLSSEHRDVSEFALIHQDVLLSWGRVLEDREQPKKALTQYTRLIKDYGDSAKGFPDAAKAAATIHRGLADNATEDSEKLTHLEAAHGLFLKIGDSRSASALQDTIVDLRSKEGIRLANEQDYQAAFDLLSRLEQEMGGSLGTGEAARALQFIREKTGVLSVRFVTVKAEGTAITEGAVLRFVPKGDGQKREVPVAPKTRWVIGEYDLSLHLSGRPKPILSLPVRLRPGGASIELPSRVPDGMTYVPAGGAVTRPFFIDRTEVTVEAMRKFNPDYKAHRSQWDKPEYPAHKIAWREAQAYASSVGKRLPTREQWHRAAFGDANLRYPWGTSDPAGRCNIGTRNPTEVGAYPSGASPYGALDMAGNVWEWLRDGWAIGGSFGSRGQLTGNVPVAGEPSWPADFLRDPKPSPELYKDPKKVNQRKYNKYRVQETRLEEVGFRCVIEL